VGIEKAALVVAWDEAALPEYSHSSKKMGGAQTMPLEVINRST
jgi:hypothetical protein